MPAHRLWMKSGASGRAINLNHTPYQHQHDAEGKDGHGDPQIVADKHQCRHHAQHGQLIDILLIPIHKKHS